MLQHDWLRRCSHRCADPGVTIIFARWFFGFVHGIFQNALQVEYRCDLFRKRFFWAILTLQLPILVLNPGRLRNIRQVSLHTRHFLLPTSQCPLYLLILILIPLFLLLLQLKLNWPPYIFQFYVFLPLTYHFSFVNHIFRLCFSHLFHNENHQNYQKNHSYCRNDKKRQWFWGTFILRRLKSLNFCGFFSKTVILILFYQLLLRFYLGGYLCGLDGRFWFFWDVFHFLQEFINFVLFVLSLFKLFLFCNHCSGCRCFQLFFLNKFN